MSNMQQTDLSNTQRETWVHAKTMVAAVLGAFIGCGGSLHLYYNLLGGADQVNRLAQVESTVEHNRQTGEETLAIVKQLKSEVLSPASADALLSDLLKRMPARSPHDGRVVSEQPTQRELSDALDGLFDKLPGSA